MDELAASARQEVEDLHELFGAWYRGECDEEAFTHVERALSPEFRLVTPDGEELGRTTVVESIRNARGSEADREPPFEIDVRNLRALRTIGEYCQVTYEEWHRRDSWEARRSTALFHRTDAPNDVVWIDLHETAFDTE